MDTNKKKSGTRCFDIIDGPGKDLLFDACKYAYSDNVKVTLDFTISVPYHSDPSVHRMEEAPMHITKIRVTGIDNEDGSGESFNIRGYYFGSVNPFNFDGMSQFSGYYNTRNRKGSIYFFG